MRIRSAIRSPGLFGRPGWQRYVRLRSNEPLILEREPGNPSDANAVLVLTVIGEQVGYVQCGEAAILAPRLDAGEMWLAKVAAPALFAGDRRVAWAQMVAWREEPVADVARVDVRVGEELTVDYRELGPGVCRSFLDKKESP